MVKSASDNSKNDEDTGFRSLQSSRNVETTIHCHRAASLMIGLRHTSMNMTKDVVKILTCTELKGHCFVCFSFWLRVLD